MKRLMAVCLWAPCILGIIVMAGCKKDDTPDTPLMKPGAAPPAPPLPPGAKVLNPNASGGGSTDTKAAPL